VWGTVEGCIIPKFVDYRLCWVDFIKVYFVPAGVSTETMI